MAAPLGVWEERYDEKSCHVYYFNDTVKQSTWIKPGPPAVVRPLEQQQHGNGASSGWEQKNDPATGRSYYYSAAEGRSVWTLAETRPQRPGCVTVVVCVPAEQKLGLNFVSPSDLRTVGIVPGSAAYACGCHRVTGMRLSQINGTSIATSEQCLVAIQAAPVVNGTKSLELTFSADAVQGDGGEVAGAGSATTAAGFSAPAPSFSGPAAVSGPAAGVSRSAAVGGSAAVSGPAPGFSGSAATHAHSRPPTAASHAPSALVGFKPPAGFKPPVGFKAPAGFSAHAPAGFDAPAPGLSAARGGGRPPPPPFPPLGRGRGGGKGAGFPPPRSLPYGGAAPADAGAGRAAVGRGGKKGGKDRRRDRKPRERHAVSKYAGQEADLNGMWFCDAPGGPPLPGRKFSMDMACYPGMDPLAVGGRIACADNQGTYQVKGDYDVGTGVVRLQLLFCEEAGRERTGTLDLQIVSQDPVVRLEGRLDLPFARAGCDAVSVQVRVPPGREEDGNAET
eukprot:TRINITY_DN9415_c0_g1_i1.p1 TRINITY_DN9415_c0_g1~~TRINITY_DN9415_c0_g1_i1.p1  ORF type:complete len:552 (+),score=143.01 TRINITY_DN9415_c0_g1_i1:142-1656(+)